MARILAWVIAIGATVAMLPFAWPADAGRETVRELMVRDLTGVPGKELRMVTVEYPPGASSPSHQHHAQVAVYVLEGSLRMQVKGAEAVTLRPGDTFYEGVDDVHEVSANASQTQPARFVVFMVRDKSPAGSAK